MRFSGRALDGPGVGNRAVAPPPVPRPAVHPASYESTGPVARPLLSGLSDFPRNSALQPNGRASGGGVEPPRESRAEDDSKLLGLLHQLQSSPSHSRASKSPSLDDDAAPEGRSAEGQQAAGAELQPVAGEAEKKKKGKNKIGAPVRQAEPGPPAGESESGNALLHHLLQGDPGTDGLASAPAS